VTEEQYWSRIKNIPLFYDRPSTEAGVSLYRDQSGNPARVVHPDELTESQRAAMIEFYEQQHSPRSALN
jgi:hypothetical protein